MEDKNTVPEAAPLAKPLPKAAPEALITSSSFVGMYGLSNSEGRIVERRYPHDLKTETEWYALLQADFTMCRNLKS